MRSFAAFLIVLACAPAARAQSVYLDFGPAGSPAGTAPPTYGGAAVAPGTWNEVTTTSAGPLAAAAGGGATGVSVALTFLGAAPMFGSDDQASGEHEALLDDYVRADVNVTYADFTGLASGDYVVHTVVVQDDNMWAMSVVVPGAPEPQQWCGGEWAGAYVLGSPLPGNFSDVHGNYTRHTRTVTDGTLRVEILAMGFVDQARIRGIQLVRADENAESLCSGDGSAGAACPCANAGAPGRGCASSLAGSAGARLYASGTSVPDTLGLHAEGVLPTALSIVLQGDAAVVPPAAFGDGLRCAGGNLRRLYVKNASSGLVHAPEPGEPSVSARSAALGDPIPVGERRYYQVYYRDPDLAYCPAPAGSTFNATNALKVTW